MITPTSDVEPAGATQERVEASSEASNAFETALATAVPRGGRRSVRASKPRLERSSEPTVRAQEESPPALPEPARLDPGWVLADALARRLAERATKGPTADRALPGATGDRRAVETRESPAHAEASPTQAPLPHGVANHRPEPFEAPTPASPARAALLPPEELPTAGALLQHAANFVIRTDAGDVHLHLRIRDGVADVRVDGLPPAAASSELRQPELRVALAREGLALGEFDLGEGEERRARAEERRAERIALGASRRGTYEEE